MAICVLFGLVIGLITVTQATPAAAADGTTDVTIQVGTDDGNIAWSVPTVVPMKSTAAGILIAPDANALAIRNLSAFPIRVKTMGAKAADPFHLVADVDKSSGNNDFQMSVNGVVAAGTVGLADDGTWAISYAGNADGTDMLPLTVSAAKITRVIEDLSIAKKAATITWTVEPTEYVKPEPKPDPKNGVAFAVYSDDDKSLNLYKRESKPAVDDTFNGKTVTKLFDVDERRDTSGINSPFEDVSSSAEKVEVVDSGIRPVSTKGWFSGFESMTAADVLKLDTSFVGFMDAMFDSCSCLANLDLSGWDTSSANSMNNMFSRCYGLTSLDLSGWNTSSVDRMNGMFNSCSSLANLDLSGWNTSRVFDMSHMFSCCYGLTCLDLSGWDTSSVTNMNGMFNSCLRLADLDLSGWDTSSVTNMSGMFDSCHRLADLDLSGWDTSSVTNMSYMFYNCSNLTTVGDLSSWDTSSVTNMSNMFADSHKLTTDCSNWDVSSVSQYFDFNAEASGVTAPNWRN